MKSRCKEARDLKMGQSADLTRDNVETVPYYGRSGADRRATQANRC